MALDEPLDRDMVERLLSEPSAKVLDREDVLMEHAASMAASQKVVEILLKNGTERVTEDSSPDRGTSKHLLHETPSLLPQGAEKA
ncbi:MAG TPA: hypothetical protein VNM89_07380 [Solirubrobacterales bacterium]|nr:hypothetical protein [Solirubrobacterales bacterium]